MRIGVARVSTQGQDHTLQMDALKAAGCERIFTETVSGMRKDRPELRAALDFAREGDVIVVYSLSRLARSVSNLLGIGDELQRRKIGLKSLTEAIDTTSPAGRFVFTLLGALGQMEVELLRERTKAGLQAARARGRVGGRPKALDPTKLMVAKTLLADGVLSVAEIAEHIGVAPSTLYRALPGGRSALAA
ncbi:recombinase family protein [Alsobacter sp. SYSU BS001988]